MKLQTMNFSADTHSQLVVKLERFLGLPLEEVFALNDPGRKGVWATVSLFDGVTTLTVYDQSSSHVFTDNWPVLFVGCLPDGLWAAV